MFYGAGRKMQRLADICYSCKMPFSHPIWDRDAEKIGAVNGYSVSPPRFDAPAPEDGVAVITIVDRRIAAEVSTRLEAAGWSVIDSLDALFAEKV